MDPVLATHNLVLNCCHDRIAAEPETRPVGGGAEWCGNGIIALESFNWREVVAARVRPLAVDVTADALPGLTRVLVSVHVDVIALQQPGPATSAYRADLARRLRIR